MLGNRLGHFLDKPLSSLARKVRVSPNQITLAGFVLTIIAALTLAFNLFWGGVLTLVAGLFDVLDGVVARTQNKSTEFGAFFDSVIDRYSDGVLFIGLGWYFLRTGSRTGLFLSLATMIGALLVSYTRARAEGLGKDCRVGVMERPERIVFMAFGAITGWIFPVMWIMLILTHATVIQRMHHVWKIMKEDSDLNSK
jgi:phosphatidylglycerophosphate synthase